MCENYSSLALMSPLIFIPFSHLLAQWEGLDLDYSTDFLSEEDCGLKATNVDIQVMLLCR